MITLISRVAAAIAALARLLESWFGIKAEKQKDKESAASKTSKKTFYVLVLLLFSGCGWTYVVSTPMTFDPNDFQPLKAEQQFIVPKDGMFFSDYAREKWIKAKIAEYEIRKRGFDKEDK